MEKSTIEILSKAGWYPNRKIDISDLVIHYEKKGFEMFPVAKEFIEEYGMLDIYLPISPSFSEEDIVKYKFNRFDLYTTNMTDYIINGLTSKDYVTEYEEDYVEEKLVTVGKLTNGHETLMISESGKMFTENGFFGNNPEEFWDRLLNYGIVTGWLEWMSEGN